MGLASKTTSREWERCTRSWKTGRARQQPIREQSVVRLVGVPGGRLARSSCNRYWARYRLSVRSLEGWLRLGMDLQPLVRARGVLGRNLLMATVSASLGAEAVGFLIVHRMVQPLRLLTERLRRAQAGDFELVSSVMLPPASSEYSHLLRGYNDLVDALGEREAMAVRLAQRERESVLGRLAATVAHEVRNPLGGTTTALAPCASSATIRMCGPRASTWPPAKGDAPLT